MPNATEDGERLKNAELHSALLWVRAEVNKEDGLVDREHGICNAYDTACEYLDYVSLDLGAYFLKWPKFSGVLGFPVPNITAENPVNEYSASSDIWGGEYGALRRELLDWLIDVAAGKAV